MDVPRNAQILRDSPFLQAIIAGYIRPIFLLYPLMIPAYYPRKIDF
jgi:hypothetical protein